MAEPFIAEIRLFSFGFTPRGWAQCNGALLPIKQNQALFSLIGTTYGGDGTINFQLPDLRGRAPVCPGTRGDTTYKVGNAGGLEKIILDAGTTPPHTHEVHASSTAADSIVPRASDGKTLFVWAKPASNAYSPSTSAALKAMSPKAISETGGGGSHNNMQPFLTLNFCIALQGVYPVRP